MSDAPLDDPERDAAAEESFEPEAPALNMDGEDCPSMAPPWMATISDLGTLLMAFFV